MPTRQPSFGEDNSPFGRNSRGIQGRIMPSMGQRLAVELYQDGVRMDMTFTDMEGTFKFERQQSGRRYEIRIQLGGDSEYVEEVDFMPGFPTIVHIRQQNIRSTRGDANANKASGTVISLASLKVPKDARKEFDKGRDLGEKKKFDEGLIRLKKAVDLYPSYAEAYNEMGLLHKRQAIASATPEEKSKLMGSAEEMYRKAIEADPKWIGAYLNLAQALMMRNNFKECEETTQKVLSMDSGSIDALYMQAFAQANLGKLDDAEKSALAADRGERRIALVQWLLGRIYEVQGSPTKAVVRYKQYLKENPNATNAEQVKQSIAKLEQK